DLVERHRIELLYGIPELTDLIGPAPRQLASTGPFEQRTRFYGTQMIRCMNQGIVTFFKTYAQRLADSKPEPLHLIFEDIHAAEATTQELVALLLRRCRPDVVRVVVSGNGGELSAELTGALRQFADVVQVPAEEPCADSRSEADLAWAYVASDGTSDDPAEIAAYQAADHGAIRELHDRRADELMPDASWGVKIGAIPYHLERGTDPRGRGRAALLDAFRFCAEVGFSATVVDLGRRGRMVTDPIANATEFRLFTSFAANALVPLGRLDESLDLYMDLRRRSTDPKAHMVTSYGIAMLYTRFFTPRDHAAALAWENNAAAIASLLPDEKERSVQQVFHNNALSLIEMHRGNLEHGLELLGNGIALLDRQLDPDEWVVHRSQLLYNRTRLLAALGRHDEAYAGFSTLIEMDPYYTDYLCERAKVSRKRGDLVAALADYDRAVGMAPPFPELHYNRGTARLETGDVDGALADFDYVLEMEPDDVPTRLRRGELLLDLRELAAAEAEAAAGLLLRPDDPALLCLHGTIALENGDLATAKNQLDAALAADPDYPAALVNRAVVSFVSEQPSAAVDDLSKALHLTGPDPDMLLNRGIAYMAAGLPGPALRDFDVAMTLPDGDTAELDLQRSQCLTLLARA
ncbi:MAG TPA: tetratricopeptide repeat protein, partial [Pseudonocardiaceae bacterium]|nr:tetratricopeptide repeat protein [Pseudonocardiaceae bacterium]